MPTAKVKPSSVGRAKFKKRVSVAAPDYEIGIKTTPRIWLEEFQDAQGRIQEGLRDAAEQLLFLKGAQRKGQKWWQDRAIRKGPNRYRDEAPQADATWEAAIRDFLEEISKIPLGVKKRKGDPANVTDRVTPIAQRLHALKRSKLGVQPAGV
jgi:hypothetical protein